MQVAIFAGKRADVQKGINDFLGNGEQKNIGGYINLGAGDAKTPIQIMIIYEPIPKGSESQMANSPPS